MVTPFLRPKKPKNIAGNKVAQAYAEQRLRKATMNMKIKLYQAAAGEELQHIVQEISRMVAVTLMALRMGKGNHRISYPDDPLDAAMDHALGYLVRIAEDGFKWTPDANVAVDDGMDAVILATPLLKPGTYVLATREIDRLITEERNETPPNAA